MKVQQMPNWSDTRDEDDNMLPILDRPRLQHEFLEYLQSRTEHIKTIVTQHFTHVSQLPWFFRAFEYLKRGLAWIIRKPFYRPFIPRRRPLSLKSGYLLMDFIDAQQGTVLSNMPPPQTVEQKQNLYRSLSRIMLDLARPLPRIDSFTINNNGEISLSHRPLTLRLAVSENQDIPTEILPQSCYVTADSYFHDLLKCQDLILQHQPNAVRSKLDAEGQMAVLTIMRSLTATFTQHHLRYGPFIFRLTDLHPGNIFVDRQYRVTAIVDLEWGCSLPIETQHPPFWLSGYQLDQLEGERIGDFDNMCDDFLQMFEDEDNSTERDSCLEPGFCTAVMKSALERKTHWYWSSLNEPRGMYNLFMEHIQPLFAPSHSEGEQACWFQEILAPYWSLAASAFVQDKVRQREYYLKKLEAKHLSLNSG
ncbi:hypothetical protein A1O3_06160 [Capronia epimyces CBS 606.96]|uniref:Uncharacterized protein n=1 Tax=Capronia epimyces CBS 606.96 TaxID=1182542 RepID=W9XPB0_9EURO|nr:uncharacterized protein A1O3_06160 [Capronia epimyces CBS 606.96]EXJ82347.1 hypothetical protein A1O3_06160 [Capronia epimyces CBS 606.96]